MESPFIPNTGNSTSDVSNFDETYTKMDIELEPANQNETNLIDMMGEEANFKNFTYIDSKLLKQH